MKPAIPSGEETQTLSIATAVVAMSEDGARALVRDGDVIRLVGGRALMPAAGVVAAVMPAGESWILTRDGGEHVLHRFDERGVPAGEETRLGALGDVVTMTSTRSGARDALIEGTRDLWVRERGGVIEVERLGERGGDRCVLLGGRGVSMRRGGAMALLRPTALPDLPLPLELASATIGGGGLVLDGTAALVVVEQGERRTALLYDLRRATVRARIRLNEARVLAIAERRGLLVLGRGNHVALLDLRAGRCVGERILPAEVAAAAMDTDGTHIIVIDTSGGVFQLGRSLMDRGSKQTGPMAAVTATEQEPQVAPAMPGDETTAMNAPIAEDAAPSAAAATTSERASTDALADSGSGSASESASGSASESESASASDSDSASVIADELTAVSSLSLLGFGLPVSPPLTGATLDAYLTDTRAWVESLCRTALAIAAGEPTDEAAAQRLAAARAAERYAAERFSRWNRRGAPHVELARELDLSPMATTILVLAAAPQIWGELARSYGRCSDDPARPLVDELLLAHLLEAPTATRSLLGRELDPDAPLIRSGAATLGRGLRPYAALAVHPAIARRLAGGQPPSDLAHRASSPRLADSRGTASEDPAAETLRTFLGPRDEIAALVRRLAPAAGDGAAHAAQGAHVRVVLRGRPGSGRRTLAAALAGRARRRLGTLTVDTAASDLEAQLAQRLRDVALRGDLPCVCLDSLPEDPALRARVRAVLDAHPGPLFLRTALAGDLPVAPGHLALALPPLTESQRRAAWQRILAEHGRDPAQAASLAARFAVGPGAMVRACADNGPDLATTLRQHRSARIEAVATRVTRLATWQDLVAPEEITDALRELSARVRHRRTVLEEWGMDSVAATAQGITALFQGGPGTGKTMAAGVIASALGYELWRVDLSKVVSKWIGETEKNLAAVFDAAEEGEIVLLFDEADSLFGKRTEVKSSHDRNANLETNYLLQRLDTFTGIAILTTNFGTAIDPAFKRRLSVHVQIPFPDEADRERLWRAHLPRTLPSAGDLGLTHLAHKYQLSGGYIRNAALRAAFLAADAGSALTSEHLHRAVALEYQRTGKLGEGRLE
jgi:ATPase family associated with various cellular activities (AAA)